MWQDVLLGVVNWVLVFALMPTLWSKSEKPALLSSIITALCLTGIATAYISLSLVVAALPASLQALQWVVLGFQRYKLNRAAGISPWLAH